MTQDKPLIKYHALAMVAGLPKLDRDFYSRDIEAIIQEAKAIGHIMSKAFGMADAVLTDEQSNAVRAAFHNQNFRDIDAMWFDVYDAEREAGNQPDAGNPETFWYD